MVEVPKANYQKEIPLSRRVDERILVASGYVYHKIRERGMVKNLERGRYHALYRDGKWHLHYDREKKHERWRHIPNGYLANLRKEAIRVNHVV